MISMARNIDWEAIANKSNLTIEEAAEYFGIGRARIQAIIDNERNLDFVIHVGVSKTILHKARMEKWILNHRDLSQYEPKKYGKQLSCEKEL